MTSLRRIQAAFFALLCCAAVLSPPCGAQVQLELPPTDAIASVQFTRVTSVRELRDGRVLVGDQSERRLNVVDWASGEVTVTGRLGDGPREYQGIGRLHPLRADSTGFVDPFNGRWHVLSGAEVVNSLRDPPAGRVLPIHIWGFDADGRVLAVQGLRYQGEIRHPLAADSLVVYIAHPGGEVVDTIVRLGGAGSAVHVREPTGSSPGMAVINPLAAQELGLLFSDGWIAIARLAPYRVDWRTPDGRWIRGEDLPFQPVRVDDDVSCFAWSQDWGSIPCDREIAPEWPELLPPFLPNASSATLSTLMAMPGGRLLIQRTRSGPSDCRRYDVVDRGGRLWATLAVPDDTRIVGFGDQALYTVTKDDLDLETLRRHVWPHE